MTITVKAHPFNSWFLRIFAIPYVSVGASEPAKLEWGKSHTWSDLNPETHTIHFKLRYRGVKRPVSEMTQQVDVESGIGRQFLITNGWSNQHPFTLREDAG